MELETVDYLEHHAALLRIRQKWTAISAIVVGAFVTCLAVVRWLIITDSTYEPHDLIMLVITVAFITAFEAAMLTQIAARRETLELLDAIRRTTTEKATEKRASLTI